MEVAMTTESNKKTKSKASITLIANDETQAKAASLLDNMLAKVKSREIQNPALAIIKQNISKIDDLCRAGATLKQVYEHLNNGLKLGISASSFVQYVRVVRKEVGSELYVPREQKQRKENAKEGTASAVLTETTNAQAVQLEAQEWNCSECEEKSVRTHFIKNPEDFYWKCPACGMLYYDNDGKITNARLKK